MQIPTIAVFWEPGFDAQHPRTSDSPVSNDVFTGDLCMWPLQQEITLFSIQVSWWRHGQLLGSVVRDIQRSIYPCNNEMPIFWASMAAIFQVLSSPRAFIYYVVAARAMCDGAALEMISLVIF